MTKRARLLEWIKAGDPSHLPVCMCWGPGVAASYFGKQANEVTTDDQIAAAELTGIFNIVHVHSPLPFTAVPFLGDVAVAEEWDQNPVGVKRLTKTLVTPAGQLKSVQEFPPHSGAYHREFFVKGPEDLPVLEDFIRRTCHNIIRHPGVAARVRRETEANIAALHGDMPSACHVFCAAVELMSSYYMDQQTAIYLLNDYQERMDALLELHTRATDVWMDALAGTGLDIYTFAINGYEWLSPDLYTRYMIPQALKITQRAAEQGALSWLHTCGKLKHIAAAQIYQQLGVDVLESLSSPPTGDIDDLAATRAAIGLDIVTRGGINVELLYADDAQLVRDRVEQVIAGVAGYPHMIGDTNGSDPPYPWANIQALLDVVKASGRFYL